MIAFYENLEYTYEARIGHGMNFSPHLHKEAEIIYIIQGNLTVQANSVFKTLYANEIAIILPNTIHGYQCPQACEIGILIFDVNLAGDYIHILTHNDCKNPFIRNSTVHKELLHCIKAIINEKGTNEIQVVKGYLTVILGRVLPMLKLSPISLMDGCNLMQKILLYVMEHYREPISLKVLAHTLGTSTYYISRIFADKIGCNFNYYVNSLRISHAQHLLKNKSIPITTVAFECGFESQRSFNRAFKQICNVTPRDYRKLTYDTATI
ncbi:MAG: AraC family transcriptional regulator [Anaerocolumna sp.]